MLNKNQISIISISIEMVEYENHNEEVLYIERETYEHFIQLQAHLRVDGRLLE